MRPAKNLLILCLLFSYSVFNLGRAHPHAWADVKTEFIIHQQQLTKIVQHWVLDDMTSISMVNSDNKQKIAAATQEVLNNIKKDQYFSLLTVEQQPIKLTLVSDKASGRRINRQLAINFSLLPSNPVDLATTSKIVFMTYEPTFYVDMRYLDPAKDIVFKPQLPSNCKFQTLEPDANAILRQQAAAFDKGTPLPVADTGRLLAQQLLISCDAK